MEIPTPGMISAVNAYLLARARAEVLREHVHQIECRLLESATYLADPELVEELGIPERITKPDQLYLMREKDGEDYHLDLKAELIKAGFKIKNIPGQSPSHYFCPALTAENFQREAEMLVVQTTGEMLGQDEDFANKLLCAGMEKYHKFVELSVSFVVNQPDFRNPLTGEIAA